MSTPVGALVYKMDTAALKAAYGRYPNTPNGEGGFTKDFLQIPKSIHPETMKLFGMDGDETALNMVWPGGSVAKKYYTKGSNNDRRGQLRIRDAEVDPRAIPPLQFDMDGSEGRALRAAPDAADAAEASDRVEEVLEFDPWLVLTALEGEKRTCHVRVHLDRPPEGCEWASTEHLPEFIRSAMATKDKSVVYYDAGEPPPRAAELVAQIEGALRTDPNVLLVGPPGCGKTVALEDCRRRFEAGLRFDPESWSPWSGGKVVHVVFSPSYSYENFVAGLVPEGGEGIKLTARPGPLLNLAHYTGSGGSALLIVDEFNRGAASSIFGDTLALLDQEKRSDGSGGGVSILRPYPDMPMKVPVEYARDGRRDVGRTMTLPEGLKIIGAYNTTDRSVTPLDAALLRRFATVEVRPDPSVLRSHLDVEGEPPLPDPLDPAALTAVQVRQVAVAMMQALNERIEATVGADFEIGHALFWSVSNGSNRNVVVNSLFDAFRSKVLPALRAAYRDDDTTLAAVLGVSAVGEGSSALAGWASPPKRVARLTTDKLVFRDIGSGDVEGRLRALVEVLDHGA